MQHEWHGSPHARRDPQRLNSAKLINDVERVTSVVAGNSTSQFEKRQAPCDQAGYPRCAFGPAVPSIPPPGACTPHEAYVGDVRQLVGHCPFAGGQEHINPVTMARESE